MSLHVEVFTLGAFGQQPLVLWDELSKECYLLDPGTVDRSIESFISKKKLTPKAIINTHAHIDHIGGIEHYKNLYSLPFFLHSKEEVMLSYAPMSAQMYGIALQKVPTVDKYLDQNTVLTLGENQIHIIETPGHTPGGVCFLANKHLLTGDTLFQGSIGRTDLPLGDHNTLLQSLKNLTQLDDDITVYPGHGPTTTIGQEKKHNPFLQNL